MLEWTRLFAAFQGEVQVLIASTYGKLANIDDLIGLVIDVPRLSSANCSTMIISTSDRVDLIGDHGIVLERSLHCHGLIPVPSVWHEPRRGRESIDTLQPQPTMRLKASPS